MLATSTIDHDKRDRTTRMIRHNAVQGIMVSGRVMVMNGFEGKTGLYDSLHSSP